MLGNNCVYIFLKKAAEISMLRFVDPKLGTLRSFYINLSNIDSIAATCSGNVVQILKI